MCTVRRRGRLLLTWRNGDIDISPTYLYGHSYEYAAPANWCQPDVVCRHRRVHVPVRLCDGQVRYEGRFRIKVRLLRTHRRIPYLGCLAGPHPPRRVRQSTPMSPIGEIVNGRRRITTPWHGGSARRSTPRPTSGRTFRPTTIC